MTDLELDNVRRVTPEIAAKFLQYFHSAQEIRVFMQHDKCPFGYATKCSKNWTYRIIPAKLKQYKRGALPLMR